MESNKTALERAFELARSGHYPDVKALIRRLNSEGYHGTQIEGREIRKQLMRAIKETRRSAAPPSP